MKKTIYCIRAWLPATLLFVLASLPETTLADSIIVPNFSFEDPALGDGGATSGNDTVPSWSGEAAAGIQMGVENPLAARYPQVDDIISDPRAEGKQYGYINTFAPDESGSLTSVSVGTVEADTGYTLTVSVGNGLDIHPSLYTIELLADGVPVATAQLDGSSIPPGTFTELSAAFDAPASSTPIGGSLQIRLTHLNVTGISQPIQGHYDNVRLTVVPPPPPPPPTAELLNISTRMQVLADDKVLIGGIIITGNVPKKVILRAIGPSLASFGLTNVLADPVLELHMPDITVVTNDNWKETQQAEIEAAGFAPGNDDESAIIATLAPGAYTAIVLGKDGGTGIGLVEAYDLDQAADSTLANISTRGFVDTGDNVMIAGLILGNGTGDDTIVVRGIGPSLTGFGVPNALADPTLELRDGNGALLVANNDWQDDPAQAAIVTAKGLAPCSTLESAIATSLAPGSYTALLSGVNNTTGVGLVEVYNNPSDGLPPPCPCVPPTPTTNAATNVASTSATLNGTVNPNGYSTTVYFQYGTTTSYGSTTGNQVFAGTTTWDVSSTINGLTPGTTYHFRIVATNCGGVSYGIDRTFIPGTTGCYLPAVETSEATEVADTCATLHGTVNPQGLATTVHFEYDNGSNHFSTPDQVFTGNTVQNVTASISGLIPDTFSSFVIVATNQCGTSTSFGEESFCPSPWDGTWTGSVPNGGTCGGADLPFTMTISKNGTSVSGSASLDDIPCLSNGQCVAVFVDSSGSVSGSVSSCSMLHVVYAGTVSGTGNNCSGASVGLDFTGSRNGRIISCTTSTGLQFQLTKISPPPEC